MFYWTPILKLGLMLGPFSLLRHPLTSHFPRPISTNERIMKWSVWMLEGHTLVPALPRCSGTCWVWCSDISADFNFFFWFVLITSKRENVQQASMRERLPPAHERRVEVLMVGGVRSGTSDTCPLNRKGGMKAWKASVFCWSACSGPPMYPENVLVDALSVPARIRSSSCALKRHKCTQTHSKTPPYADQTPLADPMTPSPLCPPLPRCSSSFFFFYRCVTPGVQRASSTACFYAGPAICIHFNISLNSCVSSDSKGLALC